MCVCVCVCVCVPTSVCLCPCVCLCVCDQHKAPGSISKLKLLLFTDIAPVYSVVCGLVSTGKAVLNCYVNCHIMGTGPGSGTHTSPVTWYSFLWDTETCSTWVVHSCPGIGSALVHWVGVTALVVVKGFACVCVCMCVCVACMHVCIHLVSCMGVFVCLWCNALIVRLLV